MAKTQEYIREDARKRKAKSRETLDPVRGPEVRGIHAAKKHHETVQKAAQDHSKRLREGEDDS